jgi:hypothetical protein
VIPELVIGDVILEEGEREGRNSRLEGVAFCPEKLVLPLFQKDGKMVAESCSWGCSSDSLGF